METLNNNSHLVETNFDLLSVTSIQDGDTEIIFRKPTTPGYSEGFTSVLIDGVLYEGYCFGSDFVGHTIRTSKIIINIWSEMCCSYVSVGPNKSTYPIDFSKWN